MARELIKAVRKNLLQTLLGGRKKGYCAER